MAFTVCTVGCGRHSTEVHGPSCAAYAAANPGILLGACCDSDGARAESYRASFGYACAYTNMAEMLDREKPDAVNLVVPAAATALLAEEILRRGIPLLMEKPPAEDGRQLRRLIRAAARHRTPHMVAFNRRFIPLVARLRAAVSEAHPAPVRFIRYQLIRVARTEPDFSDTAIHAVDTARFLAGTRYRDVRIEYQELPSFGKGVANIFLRGAFAGGALFSIDVCPVGGAVLERAEVQLDNNTYLLNLPIWNQFDSPGRLLHLFEGRAAVDVSGAESAGGTEVFQTGGFVQETAAFLNAVREGRAPEADLLSSLQSVELMECIRRRRRRYGG